MDRQLLRAFQDAAAGLAASDPAVDETHMAVLVARLLDSRVDAAAVDAALDELAGRCDSAAGVWRSLASLGFEGNWDRYESLDNSNLAWVLRHRRGIPISLAVVLIAVARRLGRHAFGINFPGHFLVQVDYALVDPFVMQVVDPDGVLERVPPQARGLPEERVFAPATPLSVGVRMLNNVKLAFARDEALHRLLEVVEAQLCLLPDQPELYVERGDVWQRLGMVEPAREAFERALEFAHRAEEAERVRRTVRARLDGLGGSSDIVH